MAPEIIGKIIEEVKKAHKNALYFEDVFFQDVPTAKNECLMFIKPELLLNAPNLKTEDILAMIFAKITEFDLRIHSIKAVGAQYLDEHNITAQHYGVINRIANDAKGAMSQIAKERFKEIYGKNVDDEKVLGGFEFLKAYPEFTPHTLDVLYAVKTSNRLMGGTYVVDIKINNETVYLVNGFHPYQLYHFTQPGRCIIVFVLSSDTSWKRIRDDFIGDTFPDRALPGSIRAELYKEKEALGLPDVSIAANGVHLSAGPVEGLVELARYNSNFSDKSTVKSYKDFSMGKKLEANFTATSIDQILSNVNIDVDGKKVPVFDLTEVQDSDQAIETLKKYFN